MRKKNKKNLKAYSLLEMLVTLVIFGFLMIMLIEVLILSLDSSRRIATRSRIRSELSELGTLMRRDLRNAGRVDQDNCGLNLVSFNNMSGCTITVAGESFVWVMGDGSNGCDDQKICKFVLDSGVYNQVYSSSDLLLFDPVRSGFDLQTFSAPGSNTEGILLVTLHAEASDPKWEVPTQFRQIAISTRNF